MGEIRSPYFSIDPEHLKDNAEIRSPYFSSGGDYLGVNAEIRSPYFSSGGDYHGDNAGIHSSYFSAADYHGEDAEIPSGTFFHRDNIVDNPYNAENFVEQDILQNTYNAEKLIQREESEELYSDLEAGGIVRKSGKNLINDGYYCIYRVPDALRKSNEAIYTPQEVSIGPIHHGKKKFKPMNTQKGRYLEEFCNRVQPEEFRNRGGKTRVQPEEFREKIRNTIKLEEDNIRRCYEVGSHKVEESDHDRFVKMVLLDAVFILEYLLRNKDIKKYGDDSLLRGNRLRSRIRRDLLLLENQLPFFILEKLYDHLLEVDGEGNYTSFRDLSYNYLNRNTASPYKPSDDEEILHFTDLVRSSLSFKHPVLASDEPIGKFYSATKLHEAAINFKKSRNGCLLDVTFSSTKRELRIPRLQIDNDTELLFGNLIALEWCHYKGKEYISHYVKLLDTLVAKPKDGALLIKNNIIDTKRDGASVKSLIYKLSEETTEEYSIYSNLYKQLDTHYQDSWVKSTIAYLREVYFGNLWISTATVGAIILLLSTLVQTICAVISLRSTPRGPS